jgi:DNA-binding Lrp family transcriptional regulator
MPGEEQRDATGSRTARCIEPQSGPRLDPVDRQLVIATQAGLPLVEQPYDETAALLGIPPVEVLARFALLQARGIVRRIALVPNHYALGYVANGMAVWDVDDAAVDELGSLIARLPGVSHCYRRVRHPPRWPYNLFVMLHGRRRDEVHAQAAAVSALLGPAARAQDILFSTRILKKSGLRIAAHAEIV